MPNHGRGGRPPKPTALHKLHGTFRAEVKRQRQHEPMPVGNLKDPPEWFTESQVEGWNYVLEQAPPGMLKKLDRGLLTVWVAAEDRMRRAEIAQERINQSTGLYPMLVRQKGNMVISPYLDIIERASKVMINLSDRLGFSPVSRPKIAIDPDDIEDDTDYEADGGWGQLKRFPVLQGGKDNDTFEAASFDDTIDETKIPKLSDSTVQKNVGSDLADLKRLMED